MAFQVLADQPLDPNSTVIWNFGTGNSSGGLNQTHPFANTTTANIGVVVTAYIAHPNGCLNKTNTATQNITVLPSPPASLSISSAGPNAFCLASDISTTFTIGSATNNIDIEWHYINPLGNDSTLPTTLGTTIAAADYGFGAYYFIATNANNCATTSNQQQVVQQCTPPPTCQLNPAPTAINNAENHCGSIDLIGLASPEPLSTYWNIIGPVSTTGFTGSVFSQTDGQLPAGEYQTYFTALYPCTNDPSQTTAITMPKTVVVPYNVDFAFERTCNNNSSFTINLFDKTNYYAPVTNRQLQYFYCVGTSATCTWIPITALPFTLPPGSYQLKLVVTGDYNQEAQPACEKVIPITLETLPNLSIVVLNTTIPCYDTPIKFKTNQSLLSYNYMWTFEPGVQNTVPIPARVFDTPGPHTVSVIVTNSLGCTFTPAPATVVLPAKCFAGDISASATTACSDSPITLTYTPSGTECAATFNWVNSNVSLTPAATGASLTVATDGVYWVQLQDANFCQYESPTRISPSFFVPPYATFHPFASYCYGYKPTLALETNGDNVQWTLDNQPAPQFNNTHSIILPLLAEGVHTISATAQLSGCTTTAQTQLSFTVLPLPQVTVAITDVTCEPQFQLVVSAMAPTAILYNWSNGTTGASITVPNGGPYQVRVIDSNGCSNTASLDAPKNPADYSWEMPTGCVTQCWSGDKENQATLLGPILPLTYWGWSENNTVVLDDYNSVPKPLTLTESGDYTLTLTSFKCTTTSEPLHYTVTDCRSCGLEVTIKDIKEREDPFVYYYGTLFIYNPGAPTSVTITVPSNSFLVAPTSFQLVTGMNHFLFSLIPLSTTPPTSVVLQLNGVGPKGEPCMQQIPVDLPQSGTPVDLKTNKAQQEAAAFQLQLAPNPAHQSVTVTYSGLAVPAVCTLYDLTGRPLAAYTTATAEGNWQLDTSALPAGVYLMVVRTNNSLLSQQKLIIN